MTEPGVDSVRNLLSRLNWHLAAEQEGRYEVWAPSGTDYPSEELLVPSNPERGDFDALLRRARNELLRRYGRVAENALTLIEMRSDASLEETEWKKESPVSGGLIPWLNGETLYVSAKNQLIASAKAAKGPRRYFGNSHWYIGQKFIESTFMGQTDVGSFIISAYTPSGMKFHVSQQSERKSAGTPHLAETISGATVLDTFETALRTVRDGLDEYKRKPQIELFYDAIPDGVSYELVDALGAFVEGGDSAVTISRRSVDGRGRSVEITFEAPDAQVVRRVATEFAQDPDPQPVVLTGEVTDLSRKNKAGVRDRVVRLDVHGRGPVKTVRVRLDEAQYELAMEAHRNEDALTVHGALAREGKLSWIYHPTSVSVVRRDGRAWEQASLFDGSDGQP